MNFLRSSLLLTGVLMSAWYGAYAQDTRLTEAYLSHIMSQARKNYNVPAIAVTLMNSATFWFQEVQGVRAVDKPALATLDDYFHLGSCSKSVLVVIAAKLIAQHKMTWHTKFFDVFPELQANAHRAYRAITLEDLFLGRAGIKAYTNPEVDPFPNYGPTIHDKRLEFIKYLIAQPPAARMQDGKFPHLYSNASYTMAAAMLEKGAGATYEELVRRTLIDGLGLAVHIGWPNSLSRDQPWGHMITQAHVETFSPDHAYKIPFVITPAGDLSMTPKDYASYTQWHLRGLRGRDNTIASEVYRYIHFSHEGFSLGWANGVLEGKRYSACDGSAGTFFCRSLIVPEADFGLTIMMNAGSGSASMDAVDWLTTRILKTHFNW